MSAATLENLQTQRRRLVTYWTEFCETYFSKDHTKTCGREYKKTYVNVREACVAAEQALRQAFHRLGAKDANYRVYFYMLEDVVGVLTYLRWMLLLFVGSAKIEVKEKITSLKFYF